jgi:low affinity Fe/Cu permease
MAKKRSNLKRISFFERFAAKVTKLAGSPVAFILACFVIIAWALSGPIFGYSDTWQLVINTGTTIITFLMVFVIQQSQNKDTIALQLKLNELIAVNELASNRLIDVEDISSDELETLKKFYVKLAVLAKKENDLHSTHSIDEASTQHHKKTSKALKRNEQKD